MSPAGRYNAAAWLVDRHVDAGKGAGDMTLFKDAFSLS